MMYATLCKTASKFVVTAVLSGAALCSHAAELVNGDFTPYLGGINGIESDFNTAFAYEQTFTPVANAILDKVVWWGYYNFGSSDSSIEVFLDGSATPLSGILTTSSAGNGITQYVLDVPDSPLTATKIAIWNKSEDVRWFWQATTSDSSAEPVAFSLQGSLVPEPGTWALMLGGLALLPVLRRRPVH
ncbi:PEP-CTERM sorting domain-containing protein [Roseateles toxinivorans]|nr:PEP-CTERM sorting domain-containing protein [Roseateles toxinivorans]